MANVNVPATQITLYRMSMPEQECPWGLKTVNLLTERGLVFVDMPLRSRDAVDAFKAKYGVATTPQVFFGDERIGGYTDLAARLAVTASKAEYSYVPVMALFSTAGLMALATSLGMVGFMGISLSMLASLKLMDLPAFTASFQKYDLMARRFKPYGTVYPFAELLIGLGLLSGMVPLMTGISSFLVGVSGATSVVKAVYIDKMALNCACIGGNSKAPLGIVSFAENAMMTAMGGLLILSALYPGKVGRMKLSMISPPEITRLVQTEPSAVAG